MMFSNHYPPVTNNYKTDDDHYKMKNDKNYQPETIQSDSIKNNYAIPTTESNYFPMNISFESPSTGTDIADVITRDKLKILGATAQHFKYQIDKRAKLRDYNVSDLDSKISNCNSQIMTLDVFPPFTNQSIDSKRTDLYHSVVRLESERNQEAIKCWKDQSALYTELLKTLGEYRAVQRRDHLLSGGYQ